MIGTFLNAGAILAGGAAGLTLAREISPRNQLRLKIILGAFTCYAGMRMAYGAFNGSFLRVVVEIVIALVSVMLGHWIGRALGLQRLVNKLGQHAAKTFSDAEAGSPDRFSEGLITCSILFCAGPMAILGSLQDGLEGRWQILAVKSVMDGLATVVFTKRFGWGAMLSALPVFAYQGTITLAARGVEPYLHNQALLDSVNAVGGLLLLCIALVILEVRKVPLVDYLPSLLVAPILTRLLG